MTTKEQKLCDVCYLCEDNCMVFLNVNMHMKEIRQDVQVPVWAAVRRPSYSCKHIEHMQVYTASSCGFSSLAADSSDNETVRCL